ncbi:MAG: SIS domain-containing protein, partial [Deltaproteobacteria bacterium]|nr:SIS domain-containing protein [Deltaproteobacteria bacterium]
LQAKGHKVGTGGGAASEEQRQQWRSHGVEPDFALSKGELDRLKEMFPGEEVIQIDDDVNQANLAKANGRKFMTPAEFLGKPDPDKPLLEGYRSALAELETQDIVGVAETIAKAKRVFIAGNGGSAVTGNHFASDLARAGIQTHSLCDNQALITGLANDLGYTHIFSRQLELYNIGQGDVFIAISGSGNSANVIEAVNLARSKGGTAIAFLGFGGGELSPLVDKAIILSSTDYGVIEGIHSCLCHMIPRLIAKWATF